jgi:hypothetical protein
VPQYRFLAPIWAENRVSDGVFQKIKSSRHRKLNPITPPASRGHEGKAVREAFPLSSFGYIVWR